MKTNPTKPEDILSTVALRVARLCVSDSLTAEDYRELRERTNALPGVDIRALPRDERYGYQPDGVPA